MLSLFVVALFIFLATRLPLLISQERRSIHNWRLALSPVFELAGCLFAGVIVYVIASKAAIQLSGLEQSSRTSLAGLDLVPGKVLHLIADLKRLLHGRGEPSLPANVKLIQLSLLATVLLASFLTALKQLRRWDQVISWTVILGMTLLAAAVAIRFPTIFFTYTADNARVLSGTAVFWSGIFALASTIQPFRIKQAALVLGVTLFTSYALITNSICAEFVRLNQRELLLASRMIERLTQLPNFSEMRTVVIIGKSSRIYRDIRSSDLLWSGLDSALGTGVLREASGENIQNPTKADFDLANRIAPTMPAWPAPQSTTIVDDVGIVVLGKPG
jgi:hypothetical protein